MPAGREDEARRFYGGILGLDEVPKPPASASRGGCCFRGEGVEIHLGVEEGFRPARKAHPAFLVRDLDAVRERLERAGGEVAADAGIEGQARFHAADPFGNRLEFLGSG